TKSEAVSRSANFVARQANGQIIEAIAKYEMNKAAVIFIYYWDYVARALTLTNNELQLYMRR
ncbi:unnamed protein product, partial [Rotaria sp. Silwood2]